MKKTGQAIQHRREFHLQRECGRTRAELAGKRRRQRERSLRDRCRAANPKRHSRAPEADIIGPDVRQAVFKTRHGRLYRPLFVVSGDTVHVVAVRGFGQHLATLDELGLAMRVRRGFLRARRPGDRVGPNRRVVARRVETIPPGRGTMANGRWRLDTVAAVRRNWIEGFGSLHFDYRPQIGRKIARA
jgi:hypothetical protein